MKMIVIGAELEQDIFEQMQCIRRKTERSDDQTLFPHDCVSTPGDERHFVY